MAAPSRQVPADSGSAARKSARFRQNWFRFAMVRGRVGERLTQTVGRQKLKGIEYEY